MRYIILALALVFGLGNTDAKVEALLDQNNSAAAFAEAKSAADQGDAEGHDWLGWFYENGNGVVVDFAAAEKHYRIAGNSGNDHANWRLGVLIDTGKITGTPEEAVKLFEKAAASDYTSAIVSLAVMQATGRGTPKSSSGAFANYRRAAALGDSGGVRGVGIMYYLGEAVAKDPKEAAAWFLISAAMENDYGMDSFEMAMGENPSLDYGEVQARAEQILKELGYES